MSPVLLALLLSARVPAPSITPASGSYTGTQTITVRSTAAGQATYCTTDGTMPRRSAVLRYRGPFSLSSSATVRCRSYTLNKLDASRITTASYTISTLPSAPAQGWAATCAAEPEPTSNVVYFCSCDDPLAGETTTYSRDPSCQNGNDANDGLTKTSPKKTWSAAMSYFNNALQAGGTIAFCKGGRWNGVSSGYADFNNPRCSAAQPCLLRDYTPTWGGIARPILANTGTGDTWGLTIGNIGHAGVKGLRVLNFTIWRPTSSSTTALGTTGVRGFSDTYDVTFCNNVIDGWELGAYVAGGSYWGDPVCNNGRWNWYGNRFANICGQGILYSVDDSIWDGNVFDYIGHGKCSPWIWGGLTGFSQGECSAANVSWVAASRCESTTSNVHVSHPEYTTQAACTGASFSWVDPHCEGYRRQGSYADLRFQSGGTLHTSYLDSRPCNAHRETFRNNEFYRNAPFLYGWKTIFDANGSWSSGPKYDAVCPAEGCSQGSAVSVGVYTYDTLFENNYIDYTPGNPEMGLAVFMGGDGYGPVTIRGNYVKMGGGRFGSFDSMSSVLIENNLVQASASDALVYVPQGRGTASAATIRNNTFYLTGANSGVGSTIYAAAGGSAYPTNVTGNSITYVGGTAQGCFRVGTPANMAVMNNNQCSGASYWGIVDGAGYESLATWRGRGWDSASTTATASFVNAPTDLTPAAGSVLVGAASTRNDCTVLGVSGQPCSATKTTLPAWSPSSVTTDRDITPDIGAIEQPQTWSARCAAEPLPTSNVTYFCDCQSGADPDCAGHEGNDTTGTGTKEFPYRTWTKARTTFKTMAAGGTIALCKGGRWSVTDDGGWDAWSNANCTSSSPCTLRDYTPTWGSGNEEKPILASTDPALKPFLLGSGTHDVRILNLDIQHPGWDTAYGSSSAGLQALGVSSNMEVCNCTIQGWGLGVYVQSDAGATCNASGWKIRGNRFLNNCNDAMLMTLNDLDVDGNYFDNNGHGKCMPWVYESRAITGTSDFYTTWWRDPYDFRSQGGGTTHTVYVSGRGCPTTGVQFRNNEVRRNAVYQGDLTTRYDGSGNRVSGTWLAQEYVQGGPLNFAAVRNLTVENNLVDMWPAHPTLALDGMHGGDDGSGTYHGPLNNLVVRRNRIYGGVGNNVGFSSVVNGLIEDNLLFVGAASNNAWAALAVPHGTGTVTPTSAVIRNNTVYVTTAAASDYTAISGVDGGQTAASSGMTITGNSVTFAAGGGTCYRTVPGDTAYMNNNQCSGSTNYAATAAYNGGGTLYSTRLAWTTATGFDANSITPALSGLFVSAPADLTPTSGSPLIGAASTATCTVQGTSQPCTSPWAIDSSTWSPLAPAKSRTDGASDIGAMER